MRAFRRAHCDRRAKAVRALGLLAGSAEAEKAAVQGLRDEKPSVRSKDKKKMAEMGFEEGIGFIPFAGIGYEVFKTVTKNDSSPLRAAVLEAIALRGDPSLLPKISPALDDENDVVRITAAACVARLSGLPGNQAIRRLRNPRPLSTNQRAMNRPLRN
jgi:HEAT repeat protein